MLNYNYLFYYFRYSDQSDRSHSTKNQTYQTATLPAPPKSSSTKKCSKKANKSNASDTFTNPNIKKSVLKSTKTSQRRNIGLPRTSSEDLILTRKPVQNPTKKILKNTHSDPLAIPNAYSRNSDLQIYSASVHSHHSGSASSMKSSDYYPFVPVATSSAKKVEFSGDSTGKVIKSPQRTVMKLAKIR